MGIRELRKQLSDALARYQAATDTSDAYGRLANELAPEQKPFQELKKREEEWLYESKRYRHAAYAFAHEAAVCKVEIENIEKQIKQWTIDDITERNRDKIIPLEKFEMHRWFEHEFFHTSKYFAEVELCFDFMKETPRKDHYMGQELGKWLVDGKLEVYDVIVEATCRVVRKFNKYVS